MQVKKSSWHYRLLNFTGRVREGISLCVYFWKTVWSLFLVTATTSVTAFFSMCLILGLMFYASLPLWLLWPDCWLAMWGKGMWALMQSKGGGPWSAWTLVGATLWGGFLLAFIIIKLMKWIKIIRINEPKLPKAPSMFVEYIKAKKRKICPLIDFAED